MLNELEKIVLNSIDTIIKNTTSDKKLQKIHKAHEVKLHFIPIKYRAVSYTHLTLPTKRIV